MEDREMGVLCTVSIIAAMVFVTLALIFSICAIRKKDAVAKIKLSFVAHIFYACTWVSIILMNVCTIVGGGRMQWVAGMLIAAAVFFGAQAVSDAVYERTLLVAFKRNRQVAGRDK